MSLMEIYMCNTKFVSHPCVIISMDSSPEEVACASLLVIKSRHIIASLQSRWYWNKAAPTSFRDRRFVMRAQPPLIVA